MKNTPSKAKGVVTVFRPMPRAYREAKYPKDTELVWGIDILPESNRFETWINGVCALRKTRRARCFYSTPEQFFAARFTYEMSLR